MSDPLLLIAFWANLILGIVLVGIGIFAYLKLEKTRTPSLLAASYAIVGVGLISQAIGYLFSQPGGELFIVTQRVFYAAPIISMSCLIAIALAFRIGEQVYSPKYTVLIALVYLLPAIVVLLTQVIGWGYIEIWTTEIFGGTENFLVSREFNSIASHEEKMGLLDCLYAVASADHSISTVEDNEISQIADELRIEHRDFISIRSKYRDKLAVLKSSHSR